MNERSSPCSEQGERKRGEMSRVASVLPTVFILDVFELEWVADSLET